jgi:type III secretion protein V
MADVLRRLLQEGIPIRNLHLICECLVKHGAQEQDPIALTELVRMSLGRYITSRHVGARRELQTLLFETSLNDRVRKAVERTPHGSVLLLSPAVMQHMREQVRRILGTSAASQVVAVTSSDVRYFIKTVIEPVAPQLAVLSYQEIDEDVALQPVGWVSNPQAA